MPAPLAVLRSKRTRASNRVRWIIQHNLTEPTTGPAYPDGLPSWWPYWSDSLKRSVRELVAVARELQAAEQLQAAEHPSPCLVCGDDPDMPPRCDPMWTDARPCDNPSCSRCQENRQ